jgi:hypothetical protein
VPHWFSGHFLGHVIYTGYRSRRRRDADDYRHRR